MGTPEPIPSSHNKMYSCTVVVSATRTFKMFRNKEFNVD